VRVTVLVKGHRCVGGELLRQTESMRRRDVRVFTTTVQLRGVPIPARGDHRGSALNALVFALRAVVSRSRRTAERTRHRCGPRDHLSLGAAVHPAAHRWGTTLPTCTRGPLVCRRVICENRRTVSLSVPGTIAGSQTHQGVGIEQTGEAQFRVAGIRHLAIASRTRSGTMD